MDAPLTTTGLNEALADRYVIERELGSGGMATVYLARDVRHQRRVALKVLHPELAAVIGGERFLAEITTTAHLQHPGILPLFDSGEAAGQLFYVMPFVDGESLRARLDRERQLPVADAVRIASEVGDALAYAHDHGVVHRDIKPENILLQTGRPIVADFGIALAVQHAGGGRLTQTGLSLGTPQYMSPEQAAGERTVDGRTDQYALAAVLYEMLAGVPPFTAASTQALIAKLMSEAPPPLSNQRKSIPTHVEGAVLQALEKLAADRFATTRDFVRALSADVASAGARRATTATTGRNRRWIAVAAATLVAGAAIGAGVDRAVRPAVSAPPSTPIRFTIDMDPGQSLTGVCCGNIFVVSPNGQRVAYQAVDPDSIARIHIRELDGVTSRSLSGTDNGRELFFSPDGNRLGFVSGRTVRFADLRSGTVRTVGELPATGFSGGGTWTDDDRIIYAVGNHMLVVPASGGTLADLFHVDSAGGQWQVVGPHFVHDANAILYSVQTVGSEARLHIQWLASGKTKEIGFGVAPSYVSAGGWLLVARSDGTVEARRFDPSRGDTLSPARRVLTGVTLRSPVFLYAEYAASANGTVVTTSRDLYSSNSVGALHIVSEKGADDVHQIPFRSNRVFGPRFSPDGNRIAAGTFDAQTRLLTALIYDPQRRAASNLSQGGDVSAVDWTADGDSVVLINTSGTVQIQSRDGSAPRQIGRLHGWANIARLDARAASGWMVFEGDAGGSLDIGVMHRDSVEHARKLIASPAAEGWPRLSPDGHRIAFTVIENGRASVQVASFPSLADRTVISNAVGSEPRWSRDGTLFYLDVTRHVVVVPTPSGGQRAAAAARTLGLVIPTSRGWDVDPAGKRFVYASEPNAAGPARLLVTVNALAENAIEPSSRGAGRP